jgi:hypothetical protein
MAVKVMLIMYAAISLMDKPRESKRDLPTTDKIAKPGNKTASRREGIDVIVYQKEKFR